MLRQTVAEAPCELPLTARVSAPGSGSSRKTAMAAAGGVYRVNLKLQMAPQCAPEMELWGMFMRGLFRRNRSWLHASVRPASAREDGGRGTPSPSAWNAPFRCVIPLHCIAVV